VIKQICPHCLNPVTLPDDAAGQDAACPVCKKTFPVQARYNPVVAATPPPMLPPAPLPPEPVPMSTVPTDRPAPPPGYVPPLTPAADSYPYASGGSAPTAGYTHTRGITFSPGLLAWLPAVCLTFTLIATVFSWVGVYAGASAVYSQGPWKAMFGKPPTVDRRLEAAVRDQIPEQGRWQDDIKSDWKLMFPYLACLILATAFAWAERGVASLDRTRLPPPLAWVRTVWPYRALLVAVLATIAFILIVVQVANGFGLQRAAEQNAAKKFEERKAVAKTKEGELARIEFEEEQEIAKYNLEKTSFYYLGLGLHLLAVLAIIGKVGLDARGNKPPPRIVIQY
jgi:hypothetical protein